MHHFMFANCRPTHDICENKIMQNLVLISHAHINTDTTKNSPTHILLEQTKYNTNRTQQRDVRKFT